MQIYSCSPNQETIMMSAVLVTAISTVPDPTGWTHLFKILADAPALNLLIIAAAIVAYRAIGRGVAKTKKKKTIEDN